MAEADPLLQTRQFEISYSDVVVRADRDILAGLAGCLPAAQVNAIIGPSGSGKTTLLNFLAGRLEISKGLTASGHLFYNSHPVTNPARFSREIAYVTQEDVLLPALTVRETIRCAADLRLSASSGEKEELVEQIIERLGLKECAGTRVGNNVLKGISGGEKRRTSIAVELIVNPQVIFLDEPTTGLDSNSALNIVKVLRDLAERGVSVICTLHQPSCEIYELIDHLTLLMKGHLIFQGPRANAAAFFEEAGFAVPEMADELEHFV